MMQLRLFCRRLIGGMAAGTLLATLAGCGAKPIAVLNGEELTAAEFAERTAAYTSPTSDQSVGLQELARWIQSTIISQEAKKRGLYPGEAEVDRRLQNYARQLEFFQGVIFHEWLGRRGITEEDIRRDIRAELSREALFFEGITVPETELRAAFEASKAQFTVPEQIRISQLTVDNAETLQRVTDDLNGGAEFALVARSYSVDIFKDTGGQVPTPLPVPLPADAPMSPVRPETAAAAVALQPGQRSEPLPYAGIWVIVRLDERIPAKTPDYELVADDLRSDLLSQRAEQTGKLEEIRTLLTQLANEAEVVIRAEQYARLQEYMQQEISRQLTIPGAAPLGAPLGSQ